MCVACLPAIQPAANEYDAWFIGINIWILTYRLGSVIKFQISDFPYIFFFRLLRVTDLRWMFFLFVYDKRATELSDISVCKLGRWTFSEKKNYSAHKNIVLCCIYAYICAQERKSLNDIIKKFFFVVLRTTFKTSYCMAFFILNISYFKEETKNNFTFFYCLPLA